MNISQIPSTHQPEIILVDNKINQETFAKSPEERSLFKKVRSVLRRMKVSNRSQPTQVEKKARRIK